MLARRWLPPVCLILSLALMVGAAALYAPVLAAVVNVVTGPASSGHYDVDHPYGGQVAPHRRGAT